MESGYTLEQYEVAVIGAGHAGCEAALAAARLGLKTAIFTLSLDCIANMPCNPCIGGSAKGQIVCEIDSLGGEMGKAADATFIQSRILNRGKGPAVHSLRVQSDRVKYHTYMKYTLENTPNLYIKQAEVTAVDVENGRVTAVRTKLGAIHPVKAAIITTGTYLNGKIHIGELNYSSGPDNLLPSSGLTGCLKDLGVSMRRFKTGTPARVHKRSIDFSVMEKQSGDEQIMPFAFDNEQELHNIVDCYVTYTNSETHKVILENLHRSPLYSGMIEGTGPRYCPSIEDKVVKFADKNRHQVFLEPEGRYTNEMYVGGMSSSLPEDVQIAMYHTVPGLEHAKIVRNAYAIEYDCINPRQLLPSLEFKAIKNLFSGGQFNGSSGYEEAAAQGLIAGINAALRVQGKEELVLDRSESYIGVLIDDLVTKENHEPYRMMTSRAEYRLLLRQDNADLRLRKYGYRVGLISEEQYAALKRKEQQIQEEIERVENTYVGTSSNVNELLAEYGSTLLSGGSSLAELIRRPELNYKMLAEVDPKRPKLPEDVQEQVNINIKYDGYIKRQMKQVEQFKKMEEKKIPENINYDEIQSLRIEAKQKLNLYRPINIGQASRISGVSPADISVLLVYLGHK